MDICKRCRFWHIDADVDHKGSCHRYAPRPSDDLAESFTWWPITHAYDSCGEWEKK